MSGIPEHECPIIRTRRTLPVLPPIPITYAEAKGITDRFWVDRNIRELTIRYGEGRRTWELEPAITATCSHDHRHILALKFVG